MTHFMNHPHGQSTLLFTSWEKMSMVWRLFMVLLCLACSSSYRASWSTSLQIKPQQQHRHRHIILSFSDTSSETTSSSSSEPSQPKSKGFGKVVTKIEERKDIGAETYEKQSKRGVPEYNIFIRPRNGTEAEWVPVGSMTIPRDVSVNKAIFDVEQELLKGTFKLYPKLKAFYNTKMSSGEAVFEYGHCLKAFPDEGIKLVEKESEEKKNFVANWLSSITNPLDTSTLKNKGQMTLTPKK